MSSYLFLAYLMHQINKCLKRNVAIVLTDSMQNGQSSHANLDHSNEKNMHNLCVSNWSLVPYQASMLIFSKIVFPARKKYASES